MKTIIPFILIFSIANAQVNKKKLRTNLHDCEEALSACLRASEISNDTIYIYKVIEAQAPKKALKAKRKIEKIKGKTEKQKEKQKTKRNFVFQLFQTTRTFIGSLTLGQIFGGGAGATGLLTSFGLFFEKYKPITKIFEFIKK
jgi:hypothetical protein